MMEGNSITGITKTETTKTDKPFKKKSVFWRKKEKKENGRQN